MNHNSLPSALLAPQRFPDSQTILRHKANGVYRPISWQQLRQNVDARALGLLALGLARGDRAAIMAPNGPEWVYADLGIMRAGGITVPVYHTEGIDTLLYILQDSGSRFLFLEAPLLASELLRRLDEVPALEQIILLEKDAAGGRALAVSQLVERGRSEDPAQLEQIAATTGSDDTATIVYTSGTTGDPKGAMLSHANILANVRASLEYFTIDSSDECLSFLPLSHVFERTCGYYLMLHQGTVIAYAESIDRVPVNLGEIRPTVAISVPRLYEKMYARIQEQVLAGSSLKQFLFQRALTVGKAASARLLRGEPLGFALDLQLRLFRALVFRKLQQRLGGRLRFFVSGGAPLGRHLAEFFFAAGIPVYEGYGLTETAPVLCANHPGRTRLGTVGEPLPGVEIRIADDGEILARGPNIFRGYWNKPAATEEALRDGWFHTGDIGQLDADGFLAITDRKKELIVTAGGKKIPPQEVENLLKTDRFIANAMVTGEGKPYLVALIVPDTAALVQYAAYKKIDHLNTCDLVQHPRILDLIRRRVDRLQQQEAAYRQIKRFTLISRDFSQADGEITPTMKLKRRRISERFATQIETMYLARDHGTHDYGFCIVDRDDSDSAARQR